MVESSPGLRRGLRLAAALSAEGPLAFGDLRRRLDGVAAPTLSRLLAVLREEGWVAAVDGGYAVGPAALRAGRAMLGVRDADRTCREAVDHLAAATGESAAWMSWDGTAIIFRHHRLMPDSYHYLPVGSRNDAAANGFVALGRHLSGQGAEPNAGCDDDGVGQHRDKGFRVAAALRQAGRLVGLVGVTCLDLRPPAARRRALAAAVRAARSRMQATLDQESA
jgi:DNA-binding IclR family transcriptional regulator